ncbi:MAG: rod-binding protein [Vampirovibrionales bacterium]|jgi:flagellar protein FlgJ|nr:rod-binding protein [Vampirovibrionales bacterium]
MELSSFAVPNIALPPTELPAYKFKPNNSLVPELATKEGDVGKPMAERLKDLRASFLDPQTPKQKELKGAAQQFEAVFLQQLLEAMDSTVDREEGFLSGGEAEKTFRGMLNQETATNISKQGGQGFGLAESVYQQSVLLYDVK